MNKVVAINDDAFTPIVLRESIPWNEVTDIYVVYQTKDGKKQTRTSCSNWGLMCEFFQMMQYELHQHIERMKNE